MQSSNKFFLSILSALTVLSIAFSAAPTTAIVPVTGYTDSGVIVNAAHQLSVKSLDTFTSSVTNENSYQLTGVYVQDTFALPVVQQPSGNAGYVSTTSNTLTQFGMASNYGSVGILAHNYLAGQYFSNMYSGETITLVYGNGSTKNYTVSAVKEFQALSPSSPYSSFVDVNSSSRTLSSTDLFLSTFGLNGALVLQTCIAKNGNSSWGRLFVIAYAS